MSEPYRCECGFTTELVYKLGEHIAKNGCGEWRKSKAIAAERAVDAAWERNR